MTIALLTTAEMAEADRSTIAGGTAGHQLMEAAGRAVADAIRARWSARRTLIACGPGNNGGDGWVVARHLAAAGWPVTVATMVTREVLSGDAAVHAATWAGAVTDLVAATSTAPELVVDALFGAGLNRALPPVARRLLAAVAKRAPVVAVDVPSGVSGDSGEDLGGAVQASLTVTFFRPKPGHFLLPGRTLCGELVVADIGITASVLPRLRPRCSLNEPAAWGRRLPRPDPSSHKFQRGHLLVVGSAGMTGAARLAARGARRIGAGLVTIAAPTVAATIYAIDQPGAIVRTADDPEAIDVLLGDRRLNSVVVGPGFAASPETAAMVIAALSHGRRSVLDAGALTAFAGNLGALQAAICGPTVMTPHEGELARLFPDLSGSKLERARAAATATGAIVVLKGADTVIAHPDGAALINASAPPWLATAGSGDVLAGFVGGLLAQGMPAFDAAAAGVWLHGEVARRAGVGLIAEDLPEALPELLREQNALY